MTYLDNVLITCVMAAFLLFFLVVLWQSEVRR